MSDDGYLGRPVDHWTAELTAADPLRRRLGAYALGHVDDPPPAVLAALAAALDDEVGFVRVWVAASLLALDPDHERAHETLVAGLGDERDFVRSLAAWLLGRQGVSGPVPDRSITALRERLSDTDASVRTEAAVALERLRMVH